MQPIVSVSNLSKRYASGHQALDSVSLDIDKGEILALLGPNGAGKTTLISIICGIVTPTTGSVKVNGHDNASEYRKTRKMIGLVPQELTLGAFDTVWNTLCFSRGLHGHPPDPAHIEKTLRQLSLWEKRDSTLMTLSGGMKRRVLIGKALSHQPAILFLDEPTAGVDVELRKEMWALVNELRESGVTIILTTHYIEEAEEIADRIGVISDGRLLLVEEKSALMEKMGNKRLTIDLRQAITQVPSALAEYDLQLSDTGDQLTYTYDTRRERTGITALLQALNDTGLSLRDINTSQSSLEEIFVNLVSDS